MNLQAVIFDMDGVIVDSEPCHEQALVDTVEKIGYGDRHGFRFKDYIGRSDEDFWTDFLSRHNPPQSKRDLISMKQRRVIEILARDQPLFQGLVELVEGLSTRYLLALASGSERKVVETVLGFCDLGRFFPVTVTDTEVRPGKPAPDIFLRAAHLLHVAPAACCVIEDSKPGIAAGIAAGMTVIAITNTHPAAELSGAHHVVRTYEEIRQLLLPPGML